MVGAIGRRRWKTQKHDLYPMESNIYNWIKDFLFLNLAVVAHPLILALKGRVRRIFAFESILGYMRFCLKETTHLGDNCICCIA